VPLETLPAHKTKSPSPDRGEGLIPASRCHPNFPRLIGGISFRYIHTLGFDYGALSVKTYCPLSLRDPDLSGRGNLYKKNFRFAAPESIQPLRLAPDSHLTRLSLPRWRHTNLVPSLFTYSITDSINAKRSACQACYLFPQVHSLGTSYFSANRRILPTNRLAGGKGCHGLGSFGSLFSQDGLSWL